MQKLHIVLSCTARKRSSEPGHPRLGSVIRAPVSDRVERWVALVQAAPRQYIAADLYAGQYWQAGMELAACAALSGQIGVSAISAGLGLVDIDDEVPMYEATLAARHPDSVLTTSDPADPSHVRRQSPCRGLGGSKMPMRLCCGDCSQMRTSISPPRRQITLTSEFLGGSGLSSALVSTHCQSLRPRTPRAGFATNGPASTCDCRMLTRTIPSWRVLCVARTSFSCKRATPSTQPPPRSSARSRHRGWCV